MEIAYDFSDEWLLGSSGLFALLWFLMFFRKYIEKA